MAEEEQHNTESGVDGASKARELLGSAEEQLLVQERLLAADAKRDLLDLSKSAKVLLLVVLVSLAMGVAAWAFLASLNIATTYRETHHWTYLLLPVVSVATAFIYKNYGRNAKRGNNLVIDTAFEQRRIHFRMAVLTFICSTATHFVGGSVGREGAAVQMGGTIASNVSDFFKLNKRDNHHIMLAGIASAFGGVFGAPIAGAFFGMEMCYVGKIDYSACIYCMIASYVGNATSRLLGAEFESPFLGAIPEISLKSLVLVVLAGLLFGLVARAFAFAVHWMKNFYARIFSNYLVAALVSSLVLLLFYVVFDAWEYAGLSTWMTSYGFQGLTNGFDVVGKFCATVLSLGAGLQGGEVTPLFGIGSSLGGWLGMLFSMDPSFLAALGMLGVFCGGLNVPITTIMLSVDMFDGVGIQYFVIVAFVSYIASGHHGVYQAQRIETPKRRTLSDDAGHTVTEAVKLHQEASAEFKGQIEESLQSSEKQ